MRRPPKRPGTILLVALAAAVCLPEWPRAEPEWPRAENVPHLRAASAAERRMIDNAVRYSPTVRRLVEEIERSDVFVYVQFTGSPEVPTASTIFTIATPEGRYLRVLINAGTPVWSRAQVLAHELQHVLEIAATPEVVNDDGIRTLYGRIGHSSGEDQFETIEAQRVEAIVRSELLRSQKLTGASAER